jgi:hypothetical protein
MEKIKKDVGKPRKRQEERSGGTNKDTEGRKRSKESRSKT